MKNCVHRRTVARLSVFLSHPMVPVPTVLVPTVPVPTVPVHVPVVGVNTAPWLPGRVRIDISAQW